MIIIKKGWKSRRYVWKIGLGMDAGFLILVPFQIINVRFSNSFAV
ncbi:MAG: hypothetical protein V3T09_00315 [bacterium]